MKPAALAVRTILLPFCLFLGATALMAQPVISSGGIVNAASGMPQGLAGGGIALGSYFTIYGRNMGPASPGASAPSYPLATTLSGVSVTISKGGTTVNAFPHFVQDSQINAILPSNAPLGQATVVVTYNGQSSAPQPVNIVDTSVGIFTANSTSYGPAVFQNIDPTNGNNRPVNSSTATAMPTQIGVLWLTGLGAINGADNDTPPVGSLSTPVEIFVGGKPVTGIQYSGRAPGFAAVDILQFPIPANAPQGCFVPIQVRVKGTVASNVATIAIDPNGKACSDPNNQLQQLFTAGGRVGEMSLMRLSLRTPPATTDTTTDVASGSFRALTAGPFVFTPLAAPPPVGSCTEYSTGVDITSLASGIATGVSSLTGIVPGIFAAAGNPLDAGPALTLTAATGTRNVPKSNNVYQATIGSSPPSGGVTSPVILDPGTITLTGPGGADVGSFTATINTLPAITWSNRDQIVEVDQTQGATVNWSGGDSLTEVIAIAGVSTDKTAGLTGLFVCTANVSAGTFSVPEQIVANLPSTRPGSSNTAGVLLVGAATSMAPVKFPAQGLDAGYVTFEFFSGKAVDYTQGFVAQPAPAISLSTATLDFGSVIVGQTKDLVVNVGNTGNLPLAVSSLNLSNAQFTVTGVTAPFTVAAGAQQTVTVHFAPTATGNITATLTIASNDLTKPSVTVSMTATAAANPNNAAPVIVSITPSTVIAALPAGVAGFVATITGTGFIPSSQVQWNASNRPTTFVSATELQAAIPASDVSSATVGSITVVNPPPGGGTSKGVQISVNPSGGPSISIPQVDFHTCPIVNAYTTIADMNGVGVRGLNNLFNSFKCSEDGLSVACDVSAASDNGVGLSVAIVIDTGAATANGGLAVEKNAAAELISQFSADTSTALIQADIAPAVLSAFVPNQATINGFIAGLSSGTGGAALYDSIDLAIKMVSQRTGQRQAVVVITQNDNGSGSTSSATVLNDSLTAGLPIYSMTISPGAATPSLVSFLNQLALNTSGALYPDSPSLLPQFIMDRLASVLTTEYVLSYTTQATNSEHTLSVNLTSLVGSASTTRTFLTCPGR